MSGLLRRLAEQALGDAGTVKPRPRPRFAAAAAHTEPTAGAEHGQAMVLPLASAQRPDEPGSASASADRVAPLPARRAGPPPVSPAQERPLVRERGSAARRTSSPRATAAAAEKERWLLPPLTSEAAQGEPAQAADVRASLPAAASLHPASAGPRPGRAEPNEVHVHIGRIEVTAVHEAARREVSRRAAPSRPLDDYLRPRRAR